ncbi:cytidylate kinase [Mariprofundus micogutta]|uniref:Cytidylate kinase n=1 Tax=Mariprofundus micogutta TaxID=1921010 RepID=A0A1L8CLG9_9PROT|nr:(d)CMP kinase [Mariprofundus micogutta]GAV19767.1 cytidylate kinase [Mariprofundus micogutta]
MSSWQAISGLTIAIDGPSGSGKGTVAKMLADEVGLPVLDTGLLYRLVGSVALSRDVALDSADALADLVDQLLMSIDWTVEGVFLDGENITGSLRSEQVGEAASKVASQPEVREKLLALQHQLAKAGCIMDGRDIGTVVLPDAPAKFFLTASIRERARRRWAQLKDDGGSTLEAVVDELKMRDQRDRERQHAPLCQAADAITIDSTTMRVDDVVDRMLGVLERRGLIQAAA